MGTKSKQTAKPNRRLPDVSTTINVVMLICTLLATYYAYNSVQQFKIANQPYLQIVSVGRYFVPNKQILFRPEFKNLGAYTIRINEILFHVEGANDNDSKIENIANRLDVGDSVTYTSTYVAPGGNHAVELHFDRSFVPPEEYVNAVNAEQMFLVISGHVIYTNLATNKERMYRYRYQLYSPLKGPNNIGKVLISENFDL